ncbi:MAG: ABC transporter ATP-binding protein [Bacteroidales bacterium]|nr:ABC transporter ATP-binding protein [Candidatus Latescibacterota bacterium]
MSEIRLENVGKSYGSNVVLDGFSLSVEDGECFSIVGPSPCGKTTVLRAISGFEKLDAGEIFIGNTLVTSKEKRVFLAPEKRNIGVVFQDYAVWPHMTVFENVRYPLKRQRLPKDVAKDRAIKACELVQLGDLLERLPNQLSGGQQQRVALARAIMCSEKVILLDEPICNLDANLREEMRFEIKELQKRIGVTVILVTHDHDDALAVSDRVAVLDERAKIRQIGTPEELYRNPVDSYVFRFLGLSNFLPLEARENKVFVKSTEPVFFSDTIPPHIKNGNYYAAFRPKDVSFTDTGEIKGIVRRVIFLGDIYEYRVDLGDVEIRIQQDSQETGKQRMLREGDPCGLKFDDIRYYDEVEGLNDV